jgi:hypothetical protein
MNTFLEARYHQAKTRYLDQCAYMHETNLKWAEKQGGVDAITGKDKSRFEGIQDRLIDLVAFNDAAQEYIESLQDTIEQLIQEKKQLKARLSDLTGERPLPPPIPYREYLQMMLLCARYPNRVGAFLDSREGRRQAVKNSLAAEMPQLF